MYKLKANGKYILLIEDLGLTVSHENADGIVISNDQFEVSNDIKKLIRYLHIEKIDENKNLNTITEDEVMNKVEEEKDAFIAREENSGIPEGVFVRTPTEETTQMELSSIENKSEEVEAKIETKEEIKKDEFNKIEEVTETLKVTNKVEDSKNDQKEESKPATKRGRKSKSEK